MALKALLKTLEGLNPAHHDLYKKDGDVYVLDLDDGDTKNQIDEFRNNNIALKQKNESFETEITRLKDLSAKFANIDPEAAAAALETVQKMEDEKMINAGQLDELLLKRTEQMRVDNENQIKVLVDKGQLDQDSANKYRNLYQKEVIENKVVQAIANSGVLKAGAAIDAMNRANATWSVDENGDIVAKKNGEIMFSKDGKEKISMDEWAQTLKMENPHLFEPNKGGGAAGNQDNSNVTGMISTNDQDSINSNIEDIASGKVVVN